MLRPYSFIYINYKIVIINIFDNIKRKLSESLRKLKILNINIYIKFLNFFIFYIIIIYNIKEFFINYIKIKGIYNKR